MTSAKSGNNARWLVGCLIGACLLFSVAGVAFVGINWKNFFPSNQSPAATDVTATELPASNGNAPSITSGNASEEQFQIKIGDEISNGKPGSGAGLIEAPGSKDVYTFTAEAGQVIYVHIIEPTTSSDLVTFVMHDEINADVFNSCLQCGDPGLIILDRGGTYKMVLGIDDPNGAGTGAYRIKIWDVPSPHTFTIKLDDKISRDKPGKGAGYIENPGSSDIYTFTTDAGWLKD